jgi:CBS domain-containing protein
MVGGLFAAGIVRIARDTLFRLGGVPVVVNGRQVTGVVTERPVMGEFGGVDLSTRMRVVSVRLRDVPSVRLDAEILIDGRPHRVVSSATGPDECVEISVVEEEMP